MSSSLQEEQEEEPSRLTTELSLLTAIYPSQTTFSPHSLELKYTHIPSATLTLRLPSTYPLSGLPSIISASTPNKTDIRDRTASAVADLELPAGQECLDAYISTFISILEDSDAHSSPSAFSEANNRFQHETPAPAPVRWKTVVIWLHHLLNTNKRKLALHPPSSVPPVSGLSKPGYPGVLVFSGPKEAVDAHVEVLRREKWAAFQVRFEEECESEEGWVFTHGAGVREVQGMGEVVAGVDCEEGKGKDGGKGKRQKEDLMRAVGIK